jgi:small subunit ribosomal protein S20
MAQRSAVKKSLSDLKRKRQSDKRQTRNTSILSRLKTEEKKLRGALEEGVSDVKALYAAFASALDKAAKSGAVHKNVAARKKSRLNTRIAGGGKPATEAKPKAKAKAKAPAKKKAAPKKKK